MLLKAQRTVKKLHGRSRTMSSQRAWTGMRWVGGKYQDSIMAAQVARLMEQVAGGGEEERTGQAGTE
jgi:hypothetical protein